MKNSKLDGFVDYVNLLISWRYENLDKIDRPEEFINTKDYKSTMDALNQENDYLRSELNKLYNSRGYRLLKIMYRIKDILIPRGSLRYKIARIIFKVLRYIKNTARRFFRPVKVVHFIENPSKLKKNTVRTADFDAARSESIKNFESITFPKNDNPLASIVIPVFNKFNYTYNCLKSIKELSDDVSYEIIITDDNSTDETQYLTEIIKNIVYLKNSENRGFLKNCNNAAKKANGKYIVFLNNDTTVINGWLSSLVELMEKDKNIGMTGSKLIYPDGALQEAGGIVWNDGTGANYGRGRDPLHAEYNYVKEVDYISGASLLIRKSLWNEIGGFDERYSPAYCEDSDIAFEVRKRGYKVVYQPKSSLIHFERISQGADDSKAWELMSRNQKLFVEKWKNVIDKEHIAPFANMYLARDRGQLAKTIVFIDDRVPRFDKQAGAKTAYNFICLLVDLGFHVKFIGDNDYHAHQPYTSILQQMGVEVIYGQWYMDNDKTWLEKVISNFDFIFLNRPHIGQKYFDFFKKRSKSPIIYYGHDLHFVRIMREYDITGNNNLKSAAKESQKMEMDLMKKADIVFAVNPAERDIINKELGINKAIKTPIYFYKDFYEAPADISQKEGLVFVGGYEHTPNVDAVKWFVSDILPLIREKIPDIKVTLAGSDAKAEVLALADKYIEVPGWMSDDNLTDLYRKRRVCIIPLRFGAGVKGKTVDAMYNRMAIVSTSIGLEGLPGIEGYLSPHDDPHSFADEVVKLYNNEKAIRDAYEKNIRFIKDNFSYGKALELFKSIFGYVKIRV